MAAGRSSRLYPRTIGLPKTLLEVGGASLLERMVASLGARGVDDIVVVVGYEAPRLQAALEGRARTLRNPFFAGTNNMASLYLALDVVEGPFLYLHSDLLFDPALLDPLVARGDEAGIDLLVDHGPTDEEAMKVHAEDGRFVASSKQIPSHQAVGEWTGIARIPSTSVAGLRACIEAILAQGGLQDYDTAAFTRMAAAGHPFRIEPTEGRSWIEVDTEEDLQEAHRLFGGA